MVKRIKYTKSELAKFKEIQLHLKVLGQQTTHLKKLVKSRKKREYYNKTDKVRLLRAIKSAKRKISDAGHL